MMDAVNRGALALLGLVMLVVGTLGTLSLLDVLDEESLAGAIPYREVWSDWNRIDWSVAWVRWVLLVTAVLVALIALTLLLRELAVRRGAGDRRVIARGARGATVVSSHALRAACAREAASTPGVLDARVEDLVLDGGAPRARLRVRPAPDAHLPTLGSRVAERGAHSLGRMLGTEPGEVTVVMEVRHDRRAATHNRRVE